MKVALCVSKPDVWQFYSMEQKPKLYPLLGQIYGLQTSLEDRATCETDPTKLQLIPYIVVQNPGGKLFAYTRGDGGTEDRLHGKISIGLGGHVDIGPSNIESLLEVLRSEAARELKEEINIAVPNSAINFHGVVYEEMSEVGKVHLGLVSFYQMPTETALTLEEGQIEKGEFVDFDELIKPEKYERLELWSRAVVDYIMDAKAKHFVGGE